jgi:hypothetical protein
VDNTLNCLINKEQYDFLNTERPNLDMFAATGALNNLDPSYLKGARNIHQLIYGGTPPNINCKACIVQMVRPLLYQLQQFENQKNVRV